MADSSSYRLAVAKAEVLVISIYSSSCDFSGSPNQRLYCTTARENCSFCVAQRFSSLRSELSYHSGLQFPRYLPQLFPSSHGETESPGGVIRDSGVIQGGSSHRQKSVPTVATQLRTDLFVLHLAFLHPFVLLHLLLPHLLKLGLLLGREHCVDLVMQGFVN